MSGASWHISPLGDAGLGQKSGHWLDFFCSQDPVSLLLFMPSGILKDLGMWCRGSRFAARQPCGMALAVQPPCIYNGTCHSLCSSLTSNCFMESRLIDAAPLDSRHPFHWLKIYLFDFLKKRVYRIRTKQNRGHQVAEVFPRGQGELGRAVWGEAGRLELVRVWAESAPGGVTHCGSPSPTSLLPQPCPGFYHLSPESVLLKAPRLW